MSPRMVDLGQKAETQRFAEAEAVIQGAPEVLDALWAGQLPKGEARSAAQIAGILAAKRTPELLPMCHPIRLDSVEVELSRPPDLSPIHGEPQKGSIHIRARARTHDRTGVEMEALMAAAIAALTLYDWAKSFDPAMEITVRLVHKSGGKSGTWTRPEPFDTPSPRPSSSDTPLLTGVRAAVITCSDRASQGLYEDRSGALIRDWLQQQGAEVVASRLLPDEKETLVSELQRLVEAHHPDLILTTGGTGLGPRDCVPEATRAVIEREAPGITEWLRLRTARQQPLAALSRAVAGIRANTLIVNLPGSPRAVEEYLAELATLLPHAIEMVRGGAH